MSDMDDLLRVSRLILARLELAESENNGADFPARALVPELRQALEGLGAITAPNYITDSIGRWPYPSAGNGEWHEIDQDTSDQFLNCMPPITLRGVDGFFVGEPAWHMDNGTPVHAYITRIGDRHFLRETPLLPDTANHSRRALARMLPVLSPGS